MKPVLVGLSCALVAVIAPQAAHARSAPTNEEARTAAWLAAKTTADLLDGELDVADTCPRRGRFSRVCRAMVDGPDPLRLRVIVTTKRDGNYTVRARRA